MQNIHRLFTENITNFYQSVFLEENSFKNIREKVGCCCNYPVRIYIDYICHKSVELQKKSKTF